MLRLVFLPSISLSACTKRVIGILPHTRLQIVSSPSSVHRSTLPVHQCIRPFAASTASPLNENNNKKNQNKSNKNDTNDRVPPKLNIIARWTRFELHVAILGGIITIFLIYRRDDESYLSTTLRILPSRLGSRAWGWIHQKELPVSLRAPIYKTYARLFGCNLDEMLVEDLESYIHLNAFFTRKLKPGARPCSSDLIVSPVDAVVMACGQVVNGQMLQIKDMPYSVSTLLTVNPDTPDTLINDRTIGALQQKAFDDATKGKDISKHVKDIENHYKQQSDKSKTDETKLTASKSDKNLYYCVLYLAPGDYHRIHAATDLKIKQHIHVAGELQSVGAWWLKRVPGLFVRNERVVVTGDYKHGFFSMTAVGAYNVGSIQLFFGDYDHNTGANLSTNRSDFRPGMPPVQHKYVGPYSDLMLKKGQEMMMFELGSTVVLVFEGPSTHSYKYSVQAGQKVKVGQSLGDFDI